MPALSSDRLTPEQHNACQRFHLKVFGTPMFFTEPVCNGKHGWGCATCHPILLEREQSRPPVKQPWDLAA